MTPTKAPPQQHDSRLSVILAALALTLFAVHFPGQASYDTLAQALDGASGVVTSNQPPAMSLILSLLTLPGVLALQIALFALAVRQVLALAGGVTSLRWLLAPALFVYPVLLIYTGIVWKDVLFAHGAAFAVLLLPQATSTARWRLLVASAVVMSIAVAVRQQGAIVVVVALAYLLVGGGLACLRHMARWLIIMLWLAVFLTCTAGIRWATPTADNEAQSLSVTGPLRQLAMFDIGGVFKRFPDLAFPALTEDALLVPAQHRPTRPRIIEQLGRYSPQRQDFMQEPRIDQAMWIPPGAWFTQWRAVVEQHPGAYLAHRLEFMTWLLGCHDPTKCMPFFLGVQSEPQAMAVTLGVATGISDRAKLLTAIGNNAIFLFRPWIYLGLSLLTLGILLLRRKEHHGAMITLQVGGLLYAASYVFIGIACDFRYTYFSTVTGLFGLAYLIVLLTGEQRPVMPPACEDTRGQR